MGGIGCENGLKCGNTGSLRSIHTQSYTFVHTAHTRTRTCCLVVPMSDSSVLKMLRAMSVPAPAPAWTPANGDASGHTGERGGIRDGGMEVWTLGQSNSDDNHD